MALSGLRYSKSALLVFGAGLVLGLAVVSAELHGLARVASLAMAAGILALPFALLADWRRLSRGKPAARGRRHNTSGKRGATSVRRRTRRKR